MVQQFWEIFDYLEPDSDEGILNHHRDPSMIAINLPHFEQVCNDRRVSFPPILELKRVLNTSRRHKFLAIIPVNSIIHDRFNRDLRGTSTRKPSIVRCWVFERGGK
ncbi:hypothetical protein CCP3SC15_1420001 [Gammaproteobacteria bacterium]